MGAYRPRSSQNASLSQSAKETQTQRTTLHIVVAPIEALFNHTHYYHPSI
ncbi:BZ3501_MvSof-1269-A2-R1_Chr1-3g01333 [Microbotryum saponariae]|nr:BZ3501_MvSof-1269-A2-R1_Chr1-3g01333 [Microbotryum saponariae]